MIMVRFAKGFLWHNRTSFL